MDPERIWDRREPFGSYWYRSYGDSAGGYEPGSPREMMSCNPGPDPGARKYAEHGALGWRPAKMT